MRTLWRIIAALMLGAAAAVPLTTLGATPASASSPQELCRWFTPAGGNGYLLSDWAWGYIHQPGGVLQLHVRCRYEPFTVPNYGTLCGRVVQQVEPTVGQVVFLGPVSASSSDASWACPT